MFKLITNLLLLIITICCIIMLAIVLFVFSVLTLSIIS